MLRINIELVPYGDEDRKQKIAEMVIANVETNIYGSNYEGWTAPDDYSGEPALYGKVFKFNRKQSVWELVRLMLEAIRLEKHRPPTGKNSISQRLRKRMFR